ncbi:MAG: ribosome maturation factor RimM [Clostridiales bacterium]|nr:ribosome maturation factor RimM [Clostridiales bacterium]
MITIGQITKPQGVRGEVKVKPLTDDPSRFCMLKTVTVGSRTLKIDGVRCSNGDVFIRFSGVSDRNAAEALRGEYIEIDRAAAVALDDGEFFIADLIGAPLFKSASTGKTRVGIIRSVQSFGAADVFTVKLDGGKEMTFAFVKALNAVYEDGGLTVDADRLGEVAVYDED